MDAEVVRVTDTPILPRLYNHGLEIRALTTDTEFAEPVALHVRCRQTKDDKVSAISYRKMIAAGLKRWSKAFLDRLVAGMGILTDVQVSDLTRYQSVVTHTGFRRCGVCNTLLYGVEHFALSSLSAKTLVIVADEHYFAKNIYGAVGFEVREKQGSLEWRK